MTRRERRAASEALEDAEKRLAAVTRRRDEGRAVLVKLAERLTAVAGGADAVPLCADEDDDDYGAVLVHRRALAAAAR